MDLSPLPAARGEPLLYFCDESHIRTSEWMAVGALAVAPTRAMQIADDLIRIKTACGLSESSEVKWSSCKKRNDCPHTKYLDYMFQAITNNYLHLHIRLSPFNQYDHGASGERGKTDTISKSFYQLLLHRAARYYGQKCRIYVRSDSGDCTSLLPSIKDGLNRDACAKFKLPHGPFADIAPRDSKREPLLQLLDVSLGAVAAGRNFKHQNGLLSPRKQALVQAAFRMGAIHDITKSHPIEERAFNIWNVTPKWERGAVPTR
jgi:hypothetical protein